MCVEMRDRRIAPAFHNYPRSLNLDADVPDLERRGKHNRTALKESKATGLRAETLGNLMYPLFDADVPDLGRRENIIERL